MADDFVEFLLDQLADMPGLRSQRMFGGYSLSVDGVTFALIMKHALYFVVDEISRAQYQAMGSDCFSYETAKKRVRSERYYQVPGELLEDSARLLELARAALSAARRNPTRKAGRRTRSA